MTATVQTKPVLPGLLSALLIVVLGISLAKLMWLVVTPKEKLNIQAYESSETANIEKKKVNYGKQIANQHLFGIIKKAPIVKKAPPPKPVEVAAPPAVKLNLKLFGVISYKSRPKEGFALISLDNGPQKVYGKNDEISKGVIVTDILPEKVILDNNGTSEELLLPIRDNQENAKIRKESASPLSLGGGGATPRPKTPPRSPEKKAVNNTKNAPDLSAFRQEVMANPSKLMDIARPSPAVVDGQFIGFRVQPGRQRQFFRKLGFRPNDIITEVNGIVLDDASKGAMVLGELSQAAELSVKVKRGDKEIFIQHTF